MAFGAAPADVLGSFSAFGFDAAFLALTFGGLVLSGANEGSITGGKMSGGKGAYGGTWKTPASAAA